MNPAFCSFSYHRRGFHHFSLTWHHAAESYCPLSNEITPNWIMIPHEEPNQCDLWHVHCEHQRLLPHGVKTLEWRNQLLDISFTRCKTKQDCLHKECLKCNAILVFLILWSLFLENPVLPLTSAGDTTAQESARNRVGSDLHLAMLSAGVWTSCLLLTTASSKHPSRTQWEVRQMPCFTPRPSQHYTNSGEQFKTQVWWTSRMLKSIFQCFVIIGIKFHLEGGCFSHKKTKPHIILPLSSTTLVCSLKQSTGKPMTSTSTNGSMIWKTESSKYWKERVTKLKFQQVVFIVWALYVIVLIIIGPEPFCKALLCWWSMIYDMMIYG